jgi:hypothetical protein
MKDLKILISTILIIVSFFLGYLFSERKYILDKQDSKQRQINIEIMKTKLKITKNSQDVEIYVN